MTLLLFLACTAAKDSSEDEKEYAWIGVGENLPSAILSIQGDGSDIWAVGADNGSGPVVQHYDGTVWETLTTGTSGDLWWSLPMGDTVWMVGAGGQVLTYQGGTFSSEVIDAGLTFYGIWGASASDLWLVGGKPEAASDAGVIYHYDGSAWTLATIPTEASATFAVFKVWGTAANDVWAVGSDQLLMHYDGSSWTTIPTSLADAGLFTVHGAAGVTYAVGGSASGVILRNDGSGWVSDVSGMVPQLNGVHAIDADRALAVGNQGSIWIRDASGWKEDTRKDPVYQDFHAAYADSSGGLWATGGHLSSRPLDGGMIFYLGATPPPSL